MNEEKKYPGADAGVAFASCTIEPAAQRSAGAKEESDTFEIALTSEYPVERSFFGTMWREVLDHSQSAVQLGRLKSGAAPFLADHDSRDVLGVVSNPRIGSDKKLRVDVRMSKSARAQEVKRDIEDGIRPSISAGYIPKRVKLVEEDKDKGDLWRVLLWEPLEASSVAIPADPTVGVGRSAEGHARLPVEVVHNKQEVRSMEPVKDQEHANGEGGGEREQPTVESAIKAEHAEMIRQCNANGCPELAVEAIERGWSQADLYKAILDKIKTRGTAFKQPVDQLKNVPVKDRSRYSYARAIYLAAGARDGSAKFDGLEAEVHREMERDKPASIPSHGGIFIPTDLRTADQQWNDRIAKRVLNTTQITKGSEAVFETPGELIEILRAQSACVSLGAQTLTGLAGPVGFPKQTTAMSMTWVAENPAGDLSDSDLGLGLVMLQPKTLQGTTAYSRQLLQQASVDVEVMVRNDLGKGHGLALDKAGIHGKGAAGEPMGIYGAPDVQTSAVGAQPNYGKLVTMIGLVADKNATLGTLGWVTTPLLAAWFMQNVMFSSAGSDPVWQGTLEVGGTGRVAGYRAVATSQVSKVMSTLLETGGSSHGLIFGNWNDMIFGLFGGLEIVVDPYTKKKRGLIEVTSFQMCDLILRHGESFVAATGATP